MKSAFFHGISKDMAFLPSNKKEYLEYLIANDGKKIFAKFERETGVRTLKQNDSLHKYYELLSTAFNDAGISVQLVLKEKIDLDWNERSVKELLWRPAQEALTGKKSTTELDKASEITTVWEHLNRHISNKWGIYVPFPHKEEYKSPMPEYPTNDKEITAF